MTTKTKPDILYVSTGADRPEPKRLTRAMLDKLLDAASAVVDPYTAPGATGKQWGETCQDMVALAKEIRKVRQQLARQGG